MRGLASVGLAWLAAGCSLIFPLDEYGEDGASTATSTSSSSSASTGGGGGAGGAPPTGEGGGAGGPACGADLDADPDHCGACGHDCGPTASCSDGLCGIEDFVAVTGTETWGLVAEPGASPTRLLTTGAFDGAGGGDPGGFVAAVEIVGETWALGQVNVRPGAGRAAGFANDTLFVASTEGTLAFPPDLSVAALRAPGAVSGHARLDARDLRVAVASEVDGTVVRASDIVEIERSGTLPFDVQLVPSAAMFWTDRAGGVRVEDGSGTTVVAPGGRPTGLAYASPYVFWVDCEAGTLRRAGANDPSDVVPLHGGLGHPWLVAVDDGDAFVFDLGADHCGLSHEDVWVGMGLARTGRILRVRADGTGTPLVLAEGLALVNDLAVVDGYVYWAEARSAVEANTRLRRVAR